MKLETKLGLKIGLMICVMLGGTLIAHLKIRGEDRITDALLSKSWPALADQATSRQDLLRSIDELERENRAGLLEMQKMDNSALSILWLAAGLAAAVGAVFVFIFIHRMGASLHDVADRADAIASGDLSLDELGADGTEQIERLSGAMNRMQKYLRETIGALAGSSNSLTISADNMRVCRDEVYKKIDLQSQQTQQAATAMAEMSASLAEVSRHTQEAATTSREAAKTARGGGDFVNNMLHVMDSQWGMVSSTADTMAKLNEDAGRISRIVSVIGDIARKTNLLALNAAIEAARAGEQGRGFAVVAGEVRRLAESTATAAGEIAGMIGDVQRQTNEALKLVDAGRNGVGTLVEATKKAGASLEGIIGMAERVEQMIAQIAIATQQQEAVATQSSASLDAIHALSDGSLVEMASSAEYVERVRATARDIERQTERFLLVPVVPETFGAGPAGYPPIPFAVPKRGPMRLQTVGKQPRH